MKRIGAYFLYMSVGTLGFMLWMFWSSFTRARPPRRYEHWTYRLMNWADTIWWGEEGPPT